MTFDFETIIDRRGKDAVAVDAPAVQMSGGFFPETKVQEEFSIIPMWVADMNFQTAPAVAQAIRSRADHHLYGYFLPPSQYFQSIINWQKERNGVTDLKPEHIGYENGVLGGVVSALRILCSNGDPVLVQTPTYVGFTHSLEDNGWKSVLNPLKRDAECIWRMDYEDMERKIIENHVHAAIFCSPHNPSGRVWQAWEIEKAMEIFARHDVYVIADEIWSDLTLPGYHHIPTQSVSEDARNRTIALYSPSKAFNLAGLVGSYHIVYNAYLRDRIRREATMTHYNHMNVLSMHALMGAYSEQGAKWLDALREVIADNQKTAVDFIRKNLPGVRVDMPEGTYMLFLDCTQWCQMHGVDIETLQKRGIAAGVIWQDGRPFYGENHIRLNLALPKSMLREALRRMQEIIFLT